ncbi:S41 family peptidase [Streptococcus oralis]|uniref:TSPc, tail specific protease n=1 Tax=Streptococcus oralis TaxID=1303 RepID=A0A139R0C6_STROR|nr:S41 family peptidase [Streptococcus oralis]KXU08194.1 TSPc, tail specific protease [Streptococcus oralis]
MKKTDIFKDIVWIMTHDSSTVKDRKGCNPQPFLEKITDDMTEQEFLYQVRAYLASFGIIGHISFHNKKSGPKGFLLRISEQEMFVEEANQDTGLQVGDRILSLDGMSLEQVALQHQNYFISLTPERRYREWADLLLMAEQVTVLRDGQEMSIAVRASQQAQKAQIFWKELESDILYIRLDNFMDEEAINRLYQEYLQKIAETETLIIDVRYNNGGTDSLYFPLLHLGLEEGKGYDTLDLQDDGMEILYTEGNVDRRLKDFETWLQQENISPDTVKLLEDFRNNLLQNRGKGYVRYQDDQDELFPGVKGGHYPEQIFVLSDIYCVSSGDNFVKMMKDFKKVTVIGRPTLGILDYSNCCKVDYDDYFLMFPTSRWLAIDKGKGMTDKGVLPDIEIPWTPAHFERDVDLDKCLKLIEMKRKH